MKLIDLALQGVLFCVVVLYITAPLWLAVLVILGLAELLE